MFLQREIPDRSENRCWLAFSHDLDRDPAWGRLGNRRDGNAAAIHAIWQNHLAATGCDDRVEAGSEGRSVVRGVIRDRSVVADLKAARTQRRGYRQQQAAER